MSLAYNGLYKLKRRKFELRSFCGVSILTERLSTWVIDLIALLVEWKFDPGFNAILKWKLSVNSI